MNKYVWKTIYLVAATGICVLPFAGKLWTEDRSKENRELQALPTVRQEDGSVNVDFLSELGSYYEEHFAYRQSMVTAHAAAMSGMFGVSSAGGVIDGSDGWLYYMDSLNDYQGTELLSDRGIYNLAHAFRMVQDYAERSGASFCLIPVPNKNTLYGDHMPYYYRYQVSEEHNLFRFMEELERQDVTFVDLYHVLGEEEDILYHKRDSHWDNRGASLASSAVFEMLGRECSEYGTYQVQKDFIGDLDTMLYPGMEQPEEEYYFDTSFTYQYQEEIESTFDPLIVTTQEDRDGNLLMFRDSFGNALLPFIAQEFGRAKFTRALPYRLEEIAYSGVDTVLIERAERFLPDMAREAPVFPAPLSELRSSDLKRREELDSEAVCSMEEDGFYLRFSGEISSAGLDSDALIYLSLNGEQFFEATPVISENGSDYGFTAYIEKERFEENSFSVSVCVKQNDILTELTAFDFSYEGTAFEEDED